MQTTSVNDGDSWFNEPNFQARFRRADIWLQKFIHEYPTRVGEDGFILNMNFQCEIQLLDEPSIDTIWQAIKVVKEGGWNYLMSLGQTRCHEFSKMSGYFSVELAAETYAAVAKHGNAMVFMALFSKKLNSLVEARHFEPTEVRGSSEHLGYSRKKSEVGI